MPALQVIMVTVYEDSERIFKALKAGASGYILKRTAAARLLEAIRDVHSGGSPMSPHLARRVVQFFSTKPEGEPESPISRLTPAARSGSPHP